MAWPICNVTKESETVLEIPVWHYLTFHDFGLVLSGVFALGAVFMSLYLIFRHATYYLKPWQQRHIIRLLFTVPIYSTVSFLSYFFYRYAIYFEVMRDCYEAFAIASFFALLCSYIGADLHFQKDYFRHLQPKGWFWPLSWFRKCCRGEKGIWRTPRSGLTWFNIIWFGIFQYCLIRVFMTLVAVVTEASGRYRIESLHPEFAHIWVMLIEGGSVMVAMYCLVQFYMQLKDDLVEHKPFLKITAVKLVIFLSFWQTQLLSTLTSTGLVKPSCRFGAPDIKIGIPSILLCIEMAVFSVFHLWAFPWRVYDVRQSRIATSQFDPRVSPEPATSYSGGRLGFKALLDAFNLWDIVKGVGRGFKWFIVGRRIREQDASYMNSGRAIVLEPMRKVFALQLPFQGDGHLEHNNFSPGNDGSQIYIGGSSAYDHSLMNQEEEVAVEEEEEENNLLSKTQSNSPKSSYLPSSQNKHQIFQNSNQASTNDNSIIILPSESTTNLHEPCPRTGTPQLTLPEFLTLDADFQEDDSIHHGEHLGLAPLQRQAHSSLTKPVQ